VGDTLLLVGMTFRGRHGVLPREREQGQPFVVDCRLHLDLAEAGARDDLACSVDYAEVYRAVREVVEGPPLQLVEAVAEAIARRILQDHSRVEGVEVTVKKPRAPLGGRFEYVGASVARWRGPR
jgi:dihydroneopterin aldolase